VRGTARSKLARGGSPSRRWRSVPEADAPALHHSSGRGLPATGVRRRTSTRPAAPPHQHQRILCQDLGEKRRPGLVETERHDGGGIPKFHRSVSRSSSSACRPSPWGSLGRGSVQTSSGTRPEPCSTSPACSRAARDAGRAAGGPATGTIFAIGVLRSVTIPLQGQMLVTGIDTGIAKLGPPGPAQCCTTSPTRITPVCTTHATHCWPPGWRASMRRLAG
jgi:hypothetical protein